MKNITGQEFKEVFPLSREGDKFVLGKFEVDLEGLYNHLCNAKKIACDTAELSKNDLRGFFEVFPNLFNYAREHSDEIDISKPIVVIQVYNTQTSVNQHFVVDGWKRLAKAFMDEPDGDKEYTFPAIFLPKSVGNKFMTSGTVYKKAR